ncbi:class I SAM-dependent methyltransferase [Streptomyces showdoensis]|uniref:SAM-dependent methyltransferase n=1 Tax=Streptomyces showdoensis TaxID=68268 RepID=A0A2P2GFV3_STREW|nr:class I SAM-dependent methyltransferase [Streptomyces showdoensis]KKZ69739.1 SAM-dependent methyltransferase [Streptomyces showdoensis]
MSENDLHDGHRHGHRHGDAPCKGEGHAHGEGQGHGTGHGHRTGQAQGGGHGHGHANGNGHRHDHTHLDWAELAPLLTVQAETQSPLYKEAAAWLAGLAPAGRVRRVLDFGSGPGVGTALLAEAFPEAEVVAVDATPELLALAKERAEARGLGDRVTTLRAELPGDFGILGTADLIWASHSLHHIGDQRAALAAFAEVLNPGGIIALAEGGLPARHLPWNAGVGRPGLEARIDAAAADWFGEMRASLPDAKEEIDDWNALLTGAGLTPFGTRSFLSDVPAPLPDPVRGQIVAHYERQRDGLAESLAADDRAALDRLLDPADALSLHRRPDLFLLTARTVHTGRRAG